MTIMLQYVVLPLAALGALCALASLRLGRGPGIPARATRHAAAASWLALLGWTLHIFQGIALSQRGTAMFGILTIGPVGLALAAVAFVVVWGLSVVVQSLLFRHGREPGEMWSMPLASMIVILAGSACAAVAYSARLQATARTETSPDALRALHAHWWTPHDMAVLATLAGNPRTPSDVLADLVWDPTIRSVVAENPATPPALLARLHVDPGTRMSLAVNPATPVPTLRELASDPDRYVRHALLTNKSLPLDLLTQLEQDPDVGGAATAALQRRQQGNEWLLMAPPHTWTWGRPFTRVLDDDAPMEQWGGASTDYFDSREACEALRAEMVRRASHPGRRVRDDAAFPRDFYAHTRCAFVQP